MKKSLLLTIPLVAALLLPISNNVQAATSDKFVTSIRNLTDETKNKYFTITINISDENTTSYPYNKVRDDYFDNLSKSEINVPKEEVLHVLYLITEYDEMNDRDSRKYKNIKINLRSETPVTLVQDFPIGIHKNTWLKLDNTITIDGSTTSPMLTNIKVRNEEPYKIPNYREYNINSNIIIEGGIWDSNRDENKVTSQGFTFGNASNILVRNVILKDIAGGHGIDAAGVNGLVVENNQFLGSALLGNDSDRNYNEAIQLDQLGSSGPFSGSETSWGYFDGSVTKNVYISNNTFGASNSKNTVPWQVGIGSHSVIKGKPYENVIVYKNNFYSMGNAGLRITNYKDVLISNNYFNKNDYSIKIYSTNYSFDYKNDVINNNVLYPAFNENITIKNNTFNNIKSWGTHINSVGYGGGANGLTKNVSLINNKYTNSSVVKAFFQNYAQNTKISDAVHYDINGYVLTSKEAINNVNALKAKGLDASYKTVFKDQLYRVSIPKRFTSKATADYTAYLIKKNTGINGVVKNEGKGKYYVYTEYILGSKRAKEVENIIEKKMQYKYPADSLNANHANNLYRVGIITRYSNYNAAKKASDDFYKYAKASSVITKEKTGKYYVRTSSLVGKNRGINVNAIMKKKGYNTFYYNTNQMAYYEITIHPFYGKTNANKQALYLKNTYNWIESLPIFKKD